MRRVVGFVVRSWYDFPLKLKWMIVIAIPLLCILYSVVTLFIFQGQRTDLTQWIDRAFQAGTGIHAVSSLLIDAESGVRGYLLTYDESYLAPFRTAQLELPQRLD